MTSSWTILSIHRPQKCWNVGRMISLSFPFPLRRFLFFWIHHFLLFLKTETLWVKQGSTIFPPFPFLKNLCKFFDDIVLNISFNSFFMLRCLSHRRPQLNYWEFCSPLFLLSSNIFLFFFEWRVLFYRSSMLRWKNQGAVIVSETRHKPLSPNSCENFCLFCMNFVLQPSFKVFKIFKNWGTPSRSLPAFSKFSRFHLSLCFCRKQISNWGFLQILA